MNVRCPSCSTVYRVDPAKVPAGGVRARCSVCPAVFPVRREADAPPAAPAVQAPSTPVAATPPAVTPPAAPARATVPATPLPVPAAAPRPAVAPSLAPPAIPGVRPPIARPSVPATPPPQPAVAPAVPPVAAPAGAAAPPAAAPRRPVNPFLSNDPSQKARRLARALVSDMVVYHPAKRREALKSGTLKQAFEEEIAKSWEEYVEQVGKELAEGTPHFTDALNEILGDGTRIF